MGSLRILVPEATVNHITNPSARYDTTDWNTQGSTVTRTLTHARFGMASLKVVTAGSGLHEGIYFRVSALAGISDNITISASVRGSGTVRIRLDDNAPGGKEYVSAPLALTDERWTRIQVTGRSRGGDDLRLYVELDETSVQARTFYVDGAQLERHPYATTYCDGDQEDCRWDGLFHDSSSSRAGNTRKGGRWVELSGPQRESEDLYMTMAGGLGVAPLTNNIQSFALEPGAYHQNVKVNTRLMTFTFHAKHKVLNVINQSVSLERLHELRQLLIDAIKPDLTGGDQEIRFEYSDGDVPLYFSGRYDGGLEGDWDVRNQYINSFPLRILAVSPFFEEDSQEAQVLDFQEQITANSVFGRVNGRWTNLNYGLNERTLDMARGPRGEVYAVAYRNTLTVANNNAAAVDPLIPVRAVVKWDGTKWSAIGTPVDMGGGVGQISDIVVAPNGNVYVCGNFTSIGGVAANYIAYWDGSTWNALGSGLNGEGSALAVTYNGDVFAAGAFTSPTSYLARWDGSSWHAVVTPAPSGAITGKIAVEPDGSYLYYKANPDTYCNRVNLAAATGETMGSVPIGQVKIAPNGMLYGAGSTGSLYQWNGNDWIALGNNKMSGPNPNLYISVQVADWNMFSDGRIFGSGNFVGTPLTLNQENMAIWNGSTWVRADAQVEFYDTGDNLVANVVNRNDDIFISIFSSTAPNVNRVVRCSGITTVNNPGSAESSPVFYIKGPGRLQNIENQTTGKRMYFYLDIDENEEVTIDVARGEIRSTTRGSLLPFLLSGSDFRSFTLLPGENTLACFMLNDVNAQMSVQVNPRHWSADATGRGDEL